MYVRGKLNYVDNINVDLFSVDELHMFLQDLGYDPKQLMFYHYKLPNKSLDYGLRPLSCDADVVSLINLVENCKVVEVFIEYWLTSVDHQYLSPFMSHPDNGGNSGMQHNDQRYKIEKTTLDKLQVL
ncbi:hypothetical protein Tco_1106605 [Tanacetum coccineum]